ncbi:hypothetical protein INT48_001257 [Thamnidium elegans]|uniref:Uncharacterized protein n=1 Tax=Thamnidium elegans TaxID=101142 RepID=A0A8H7VQT0_9FUNG|nr:hypothetical protein INT48_001257 [Thamnidium elegans]
MFTNMVRTDGYGIDFILTVPERQSNKLSNLDLNDFTPEEINERFHLWGVNPGQINIFTASDGHNTNPHQLRKYSTAEYYTRTGQRADAEMVNIFVNGDNRIPLVALGEAIFPTSMKGTIPGLARRLVTVLKKAEDEDLLVTVPVTEYITSKLPFSSPSIEN